MGTAARNTTMWRRMSLSAWNEYHDWYVRKWYGISTGSIALVIRPISIMSRMRFPHRTYSSRCRQYPRQRNDLAITMRARTARDLCINLVFLLTNYIYITDTTNCRRVVTLIIYTGDKRRWERLWIRSHAWARRSSTCTMSNQDTFRFMRTESKFLLILYKISRFDVTHPYDAIVQVLLSCFAQPPVAGPLSE